MKNMLLPILAAMGSFPLFAGVLTPVHTQHSIRHALMDTPQEAVADVAMAPSVAFSPAPMARELPPADPFAPSTVPAATVRCDDCVYTTVSYAHSDPMAAGGLSGSTPAPPGERRLADASAQKPTPSKLTGDPMVDIGALPASRPSIDTTSARGQTLTSPSQPRSTQ